MSEAEAAAPVAASPKKAAKSAAAAKKPRAKPAHPKTADMVNGAIKNLKERGGSSLQAIKKYVSANYKVDAEKLSPFIKKYLKGAVAAGKLVQTKGKGA
nr:histone H1 [Tanacetum cinerariifolium]